MPSPCLEPYYNIVDLTPLPLDVTSVVWVVTGDIVYVQMEPGKIKILSGNGTVSAIIHKGSCQIDLGVLLTITGSCSIDISINEINGTECIEFESVFYSNIWVSFTNAVPNQIKLIIYEGITELYNNTHSSSTGLNFALAEANGQQLRFVFIDIVTNCSWERFFNVSNCNGAPNLNCGACDAGVVHQTTNIVPPSGLGLCDGSFDIDITNVPIGCEWVIQSIRNSSFVPIFYYPVDGTACGTFTLVHNGANSYSCTGCPAGSYIFEWGLVGDPDCHLQTVRINLL